MGKKRRNRKSPSEGSGEPSLSDKRTEAVEGSTPPVPASAPVELEVGMRVGKLESYEVLDKVGEGGMGSVWRVKNTGLHGRIMAMKRILQKYEADPHLQRRFDREIGAIAKLKHENIVTVTEAGSDHLGRYLVMEFIEGEPLDQLLRGDPLPEKRAVEVFRGLCEGVAHAHENGVIHRDIKPANVMIDKRGRPILVDFGLARDEARNEGSRFTQSNKGMGTPHYMAPEQMVDAKSADERSDIYSLGATLYHLLAHLPPNPLDVTEVPARWQTLITRCCKRKPKVRYRNLAELQDAVKEALEASTPEPVGPVGKDEDDLRCRSCGQHNRDPARYCTGCGESLFIECPACSKEMRSGQVHCGHCGAGIDAVFQAESYLERARTALKAAEMEDAQLAIEGGQAALEGARLGAADGLLEELCEMNKIAGVAGFQEKYFAVAEEEQDVILAQVTSRQVDWLWDIANAGHPVGQFILGLYFESAALNGDITEVEAEENYRNAANQGHVEAQNKLGDWYLKYPDWIEGRDEAEAVTWYRKAADHGNAAAQKSLGDCYFNGWAVDEDEAKAMKWYEAAARQGNEEAQKSLGSSYLSGWGHRAANSGSTPAQNTLGDCYRFGWCCPGDVCKAAEWYGVAAREGNEEAQNNLGDCYRNGWGVVKDEAESVMWYRKAADVGNADAQYNLGISYDNGDGVSEDKAEAVKWYRKAADQGHADAQYNLGISYDNGDGVFEDKAEAVKWYRKAADQGSADAQCNLGICYYRGDSVSEDKAEAVKWYRKAADQGSAAAQCNLGICYNNGKGVSEDKTEAVKWFRKAADQGSAAAQYNLNRALNSPYLER